MMLQQLEGDDYVIATGESHTIREFLAASFGMVGLDWNDHVTQDPKFFRPAEVDYLHGDCSKARAKLGWEPRTSFAELVRLMVVADLEQEGLDPEKHVRL